MLIEINNNNRAIAKEVLILQKLSYKIEADIINYSDIPPLRETENDIMNSPEKYLAFYEGDKIAGVLTYEKNEDTLTICKMMIHPNHFKKGIAGKLLNYIFKIDTMVSKIKVSTGAKNTPAINLIKNTDLLT
jgi:predicted GNAT family acetyltransferase